MKPMFMLCPHCTFPVVVHPIEAGSLRRCRQCREEFVPGESPRRGSASGRRGDQQAARSSLQSAVRQQRRSLK